MTSAPANIAGSNIADAADNADRPDQTGEPVEEAGRQRKRGAELEQAIRDATVAELASTGYGALTIESVAARAQTGKASIYRRWPTKQDLVFDSICCVMSGPELSVGSMEIDEHTSTRDALLALTIQAAEGLAGAQGDVMRSMMAEMLRDPSFAETFEGQFHDPRKDLLRDLLVRGVERGEVRPDIDESKLIDVLAGSIIHRYLVRRQPPVRSDLVNFIDGFVMPALRP